MANEPAPGGKEPRASEGASPLASSWISDRKVMAAKFLRVFVCALISIILPIYLLDSGYSYWFVGIVTTLTILSAIPFNIVVTYYVKRIGERRLLVILSGFMAASGLLFAWNPNWWTIVIAAIVGLISANGTETGPFQAIEQAILSTKAEEKDRTRSFSVYNFVGYAAMSFGSLFSGVPQYLGSFGVDVRSMLYLYTIAAVAQAIIYLSMRDLDRLPGKDEKTVMSPETRRTVAKLSLLFSLDAFGGGFILKLLLTTWFYSRYGMNLGELSMIFFVSDVITAFSIFLAPYIARRIGLLRTMVATHIPSNIFLILIPFAPTAAFAVACLFCRQSVSQMDVPTRQSYVMAIVRPEDRTATAAVTNTSRTFAQALSPPMATSLMAAGALALPFVLGGGFKIFYDVSVYLAFRNIKPPEEMK